MADPKHEDHEVAEVTPKKGRGGRRSKLAALIEDTPERYAEMLQYLRLGATITAVAGNLGIDPSTFTRWLGTGREATKGKYRRFYEDVVAAISHASIMCETEVRVNSPMAWLKNGPRRLLSDEWRDEPSTDIHVHGEIDHDHAVYDGRAPASNETLAAALVELRNAGLLTFNEAMTGKANTHKPEPLVLEQADEDEAKGGS